jgi:uncharacterized zinc-type alcohol dehydrogenase-like protein
MDVKIGHTLGAEVRVLTESLKKRADGNGMGADRFYATSDPQMFEKLKGYFRLIINTVAIGDSHPSHRGFW